MPSLKTIASALVVAVAALSGGAAVASEGEDDSPPAWLATSGAANWYLGLGQSFVTVDYDYDAIGRQSSTGLALFGGYRFTRRWSLELSGSFDNDIDAGDTCDPLGSCATIYYPADSGSYDALALALKVNLLPGQQLSPWLGIGQSWHTVSWDEWWYYVSGSGTVVMAGVDYRLHPHWTARLDVMRHTFSGRDNYGYGPYAGRTTQIDVGLAYEF